MKILVVGSTNYTGSESKRECLIAACRDLGKALAETGCELVVRTDSENSADRYVVEGAIGVPGMRKIWVFRPEKVEGTPFVKERAAHDGNIEFIYQIMTGPWASACIPQILAADGVILIGGGSGTAEVGYVATALERPVLALPSFGGAAADLWPSLSPFYERMVAMRDKLGDFRVDWQSSNAKLAIQVLQEAKRRQIFRRETVRPQITLLMCAFALFVVWIWMFVSPSGLRAVAFFALLGISAFLGVALRNALSLLRDPTARLSVGRITTEATAGLVLALGLALTYLIGGFTIVGNFEFISSSTLPESYQRIALAMSVLGLAAGWLIERVSEGLRQWLSEPWQSRGTGGGAA